MCSVFIPQFVGPILQSASERVPLGRSLMEAEDAEGGEESPAAVRQIIDLERPEFWD